MRFAATVAILVACLSLAAALYGAAATSPATAPRITRLPKVGILPTAPCELFTVEVGAKVFVDGDATLESVAPELRGLNGVRLLMKGGNVTLDSRAPVQLLLAAAPPTASAPAGPVLRNAATVRGQPPLDVTLLPFDKGKRTLTLPGGCIILGVIPAGVELPPHGMGGE